MLDIEESIVHNHNESWMKMLCKVLRPYYLLASVVSMPNRLLCDAFVHCLPQLRFRKEPELVVLFGGLRDGAERIAELAKKNRNCFFLVGGNTEERRLYNRRLAELGVTDFINLSPVTNTREEAKAALTLARSLGASSLGVLTYETHATRAILTCVKVALEMDLRIPIIPIVYADSTRYCMDENIMMVGVLREAIKLARWQKRKHVATLQEAMAYYKPWLVPRGGKQ